MALEVSLTFALILSKISWDFVPLMTPIVPATSADSKRMTWFEPDKASSP